MITLCMDTSHIFLALGILKDGQVLVSFQERCWKKQSEEIFPRLIGMMEEAGLTPDDIDRTVITSGPGSYTGVRIAMTVAKVFCSMKNIPLYTIGTLQLYAGREDCRVVLDARGKRCYTAAFRSGICVSSPAVVANDQIDLNDSPLQTGDLHLFGREDRWPDLIANFALLEDQWQKADNVHLVAPDYLKDSEAYLIRK